MPRHKEYDVDDVLDRAVDAFWQRGYRGTSIRDLELSMGINRYSIYDSFESKDKLFRRALERYYDKHLASWTAPLRDPHTPGLTAIHGFLQGIGSILDARMWGCLATNTVATGSGLPPEFVAQAASALRCVEAAFLEALQRAIAAGELAPAAEPEALARYLVTSAQGVWVYGQVMREPSARQQHVELVMRALHA